MLDMKFVYLVYLFILVSAEQPHFKCGDELCTCDPNLKIAKCINHGKKLSYIPSLPPYIETITFSDNFLPRVSRESLSNISSLRLHQLTIGHSSVREISRDAFDVFHGLNSLTLKGNPVNTDSLCNLLSTLGKLPLEVLNLQKMNISNSWCFSNLRSDSLLTIDLDKNRLRCYNHSHFKTLTNIDTLSLGHNQIEDTELSFSSTLNTLNLRDNSIHSLPDFCLHNGIFPNLGELKLDHNSLSSIENRKIQCLSNLKVLSLDQNNIFQLESNTFYGMNSLKDLILRSLRLTVIDGHAFNNSNLEYLSLTSSHVLATGIHRDAFKGCTNIQSLDLSFSELHSATDEDFDNWFGHLTTLTGLGLGGSGLSHFPRSLFQKLKNIQYLKLYGNHFTQIPPAAFDGLRNLTHLWLDDNLLARVNEESFPPEIRQNLQVINFMNNPFSCDCDLLWFLKWTKSDTKKFQNYPKDYVCGSPHKMKAKLVANLDLTEYTCLLPLPALLAVVGTSGTVLLLILLVSLTYRWRWHIRYFLYQRKGRREDFRQPRQYQYDAYVIYSVDDITWVKNELIQTVETANGYQLYIRDRDSLAGVPIVDNVVDNMAASRCVVVVLSNALARDEQCQFELMLLQREQDERRPVILVLLEDVECDNVTQCVYALVRMHSYISWTEQQDARQLFWNRLLYSMYAERDHQDVNVPLDA